MDQPVRWETTLTDSYKGRPLRIVDSLAISVSVRENVEVGDDWSLTNEHLRIVVDARGGNSLAANTFAPPTSPTVA